MKIGCITNYLFLDGPFDLDGVLRFDSAYPGRSLTLSIPRPFFAALALVAGMLFAPLLGFVSTASAQESCVTDLDAGEITERIDLIHASLQRGQRGARLWYYGWVAAMGASLVYQGIQFGLADSRKLRIEAAVAFVGPFVGSTVLALRPFDTTRVASRFALAPNSGVARLRFAESLLYRAAERESADTAWYRHVVTLVYAGIAGLVSAYRLDRRMPGLRNFLTIFIGGEIQLWTYPRAARRSARDYRATYGSSVCP